MHLPSVLINRPMVRVAMEIEICCPLLDLSHITPLFIYFVVNSAVLMQGIQLFYSVEHIYTHIQTDGDIAGN